MAKKKEKIYNKKHDLGYIGETLDFFTGDLDAIIDKLQAMKDKHSDYNEFEVEMDDDEYRLIGYRPETVIEKKDRLAKQVKAKAAARKRAVRAKDKTKAAELKQLKKLINKYKDELGDEDE